MVSTLTYLFSLVLVLCEAERIIPVKEPNHPLVTFGSCNKPSRNPNPEVFQRILDQNPDVWIWIGDVNYLFKGHEDDAEIISSNFTRVKNSPFYKELRTNTHVIGAWDDHDYGENDGDKHYRHKERNKQLFLDFLDEPVDSPRRTRDGVYESYYLGDEKRVKVILLDVRYNKDSRFLFGEDMLGENQWAWLEQEIKNDPADFTLITSGSQILPDDRIFPEHWYEASRARLINLIRKYQLSGVILLSGDVHYSEIMRHPCPERVGYNLYEFTSSGLTHFISDYVPLGGDLFNHLFPHTFNTPGDRFMEKNFGVIKFSFDDKEPKAILETHNDHGTKVMERVILKSELQYQSDRINMTSSCVLDKNPYGRLLWKYFTEIFGRNRFLIQYTIVVGFICLGFLSCVLLVLLKRKFLLNLLKSLYRTIFMRNKQTKQD